MCRVSHDPGVLWLGKPVYLDLPLAATQLAKLVVDGDSMTAASYSYFYQAQVVPASTNLAVPAATIIGANSPTARAASFDAQYVANSIGLVMIGTNSLNGGVSGADCLTQLWAYVDGRATAGYRRPLSRFYVFNSPKRSAALWPLFPQAEWAIFNAGIAADWASHCDGYIDVTDMPGSAGDARYYDADGLHITPLGHQWIYQNRVAPLIYGERFP